MKTLYNVENKWVLTIGLLSCFAIVCFSCKQPAPRTDTASTSATSSSATEDTELTDRLNFKHFIGSEFGAIHFKFLSPDAQFMISRYLSHSSMLQYTKAFQKALASYVRSPKVLNGLAYLNFKPDEKYSKGDIQKLLTLYYLEKRLAAAEAVDDPRYSPYASMLQGWLRDLGSLPDYLKKLEGMSSCAMGLSGTPDSKIGPFAMCVADGLPQVASGKNGGKVSFSSIDISSELPGHPGVVISRTGFIHGNKVTLLNQVRGSWDSENVKTLETYHNGPVKAFVDKWGDMSDQDMFEGMLKIVQGAAPGTNPVLEVFGKDDSFDVDKSIIWKTYSDPNDPSSSEKNQIFPNIIKTIRQAQSTIFMDMFFLGGSMGVAFVNEIVRLLEQKQGLKFFFLHDDVNHFGYRKEMAPIFAFLRAYMVVHPDRMLVLPTYFYKNASGFPSFLSNLVDDQKLKRLGFHNKLALYLKAKADHSKVLVIDGDTPEKHPIALVGSKNLTDLSGAFCNDEVMLIEGPAATVILDNYWRDLYIALKYEWIKGPSFMGRYLDQIYEKSWAKQYGTSTEVSKKIQFLIAPIDVLKRYKRKGGDFTTRMEVVKAASVGNDTIRVAENSIGSFITSCIYDNIHAIMHAKKQILVNDQLLFSPRIVDALIKKAKEGIEVKAILESFAHEGTAPGMPNVLYLQDMQKAGVQVKWKKHGPTEVFIPEHHGKTISVDGFSANGEKISSIASALIVGSANKDIMTMLGGFRETQVEVFNAEAQKQHDTLFWRRWNDREKGSEEASLEILQRSKFAEQITQEGMTIPGMLSFSRNFLDMAYSLTTIEVDEQGE